MAATKQQIDLGEYELDRETKNTYRYAAERNGRPDTHYVQKSEFPQGAPPKVRVILEFTR